MSLKRKRILDLVEENYVFASVLDHFGIDFYEFPEQYLTKICEQKGLKPSLVISSLEDVIEEDREHLQYLMSLPVDLVICYLKHKHFSFIKHTLPYLVKLVESFSTNNEPAVIKDIRAHFPLFVDDFIRHIYQEERTIFKFIEEIDGAVKGNINPSKLFFSLRANSINNMASKSMKEDGIMLGVREITNDFAIDKGFPVLLKVIYSELQSFEKNLIIHARIEHEVLFPKALLLEKELYKQISKNSYLN